MQKVLMVSFYFPPLGGGGVQRSVKLVKYLPLYGWEPVVLTSSCKDYYAFDKSLFEDLPKTLKIVRTPLWDMLPVYEWLYKFRLNALAHYLREREAYFMVPDKRCGWIPHAYEAGLKAITLQKINALFTTSEPYSSHMIGLFLKLRTGIPWIADFRDEWSDNTEYQKTYLHTKLHKYLEMLVLKNADIIISTSKQITDILSKKLPHSTEKFITITNGYDEEDLVPVRKNSIPTKKFIILYTGNAAGRQTPDCFFKAVGKFLCKHQMAKDFIEIRFIGIPPPSFLIEDTGLKGVVTLIRYIEHKDLIRHFAEATVLLLVVTTLRGGHVIPGKTFEYIATGKPILTVVPPEGATAYIVKKANAGIIVSPDNTEQISNALEQYYREWEQFGRIYTDPNWSFIEQFERKRTTEQFAKVLNSLLEQHNQEERKEKDIL